MTSSTRPKTTRRPKGSGSEWKDAKGKWHARKDAGVNPHTGKRRYIEAQASTKTEARVKPRTLDTYRSDCNTIRAHLGGMRIDRITPGDIDRMCATLAKDRSGKTVHNLWIRLRQLLDAAVRERLIPTNPALAAIPPRYEPADTRILKEGEPGKAIQAARTPAKRKWDMLKDDAADHAMWQLMFDLAFETGMRQTERFALTPENLVTRNGIHGIQIDRELQHLRKNAEIPPTGSKHGTSRANSGSYHPKAARADDSSPSATTYGSACTNAPPIPTTTNSSSPAKATHSPATSNAAAGNAPSRTPASPTTPPCAPHATSSAPTSPKPAPAKTHAKPSWATPRSPPQPATPTGPPKPSPRSPTRPARPSEAPTEPPVV